MSLLRNFVPDGRFGSNEVLVVVGAQIGQLAVVRGGFSSPRTQIKSCYSYDGLASQASDQPHFQKLYPSSHRHRLVITFEMDNLMEPFSLTAHPYRSPARKNCAYELGNNSARNALVFLGGLADGPHTTPYVRYMSRYLETQADLGYSVFEIRMRSSYEQFGTSSLQEDVEDISALVKYLREKGRNKIVLMGHSTGCQDCMEYTNYARYHNEPVDGFILQAPVSDRDALEIFFPEWQGSLDVADQMIADGKSDWCVPKDKVPPVFNCPMTAYRLRSLIAKDGDDDYFSADLDDEKVKRYWGRFRKPVLALHSEKDEFVPPRIDQAALNKRYQDASPMVSPLSGLIPNTGHTVLNDDARQWLSERVAEFLRALQ